MLLAGILDPIYKVIAFVLAAFYSVVPNLGVSIILLTFTIMLVLYPLTAKQARSMIAMSQVQPEIKRIQAKYKNDRQKLNEEMMAFYKENKINPLAGCLPLVAQMPIFISLFQVLKNSYKWVPKDSKLYHALCGGFGNSCGTTVTKALHKQFPGFAVGDTLIHSLGKFLGMLDLSLKAIDKHSTFFTGLPYFTLVAMVMITGYLQSRQAQRRTPQINKQMAIITKLMPIMFGFFSLQFPSGLVLYFFVSNLWRLGQQEVIFRKYGSAHAPKSTQKKLVQPDVIDVEGRDRPTTTATKSKPEPRAEIEAAEPDVQPTLPSASPARPGGGLRGLFKIAPPDAEARPASAPAPVRKPAPRPAPKAPSSGSSRGSSTSSSTGRPGQAGRRSQAKKKKR